jgi:hypothetical protein
LWYVKKRVRETREGILLKITYFFLYNKNIERGLDDNNKGNTTILVDQGESSWIRSMISFRDEGGKKI